PGIEPVPVAKKEIFSRPTLRMTYRHLLINIPLSKLTVSVKNAVPEKILEPEIVLAIISQSRDVNTRQVTFDNRPEFCRILTGILPVCLGISEKGHPPS